MATAPSVPSTDTFDEWRLKTNTGLALIDALTGDIVGTSDSQALSNKTHTGNFVIGGGACVADFIHVQPTTSQDVGGANGAISYINWDTTPLHIDTATFTHSSVTNPSRIQVLSTGRYHVKASISALNTGGNRVTLKSAMRVNGTTQVLRGANRNYSRGAVYGDTSLHHDTEIDLTANDYLEIQSIVEDADGTYVINTIIAECELIIRRIG